MGSPKETIAANRAKRAASGLPPLSDINQKPPLTVVINPEYTNQLTKDAAGYALPNIDCWKCDTQVGLDTRPYTWTIGQVNYEFKNLASYRCDPCNINYFPEGVRQGMVKKIDELEPTWQSKRVPRRSPYVEAYYARYGPPQGPRKIGE